MFLKPENRTQGFFPFFENFDRALGTLGIGIAKIRLKIRLIGPNHFLNESYLT